MALVEERIGALGVRIVIVLRLERRLQVGGVINRVGPGVGGQKLVMGSEALAQVSSQPVVDRAATRNVCWHVTERYAAAERERIARRIKAFSLQNLLRQANTRRSQRIRQERPRE